MFILPNDIVFISKRSLCYRESIGPLRVIKAGRNLVTAVSGMGTVVALGANHFALTDEGEGRNMKLRYIIVKNRNYALNGPYQWLIQEDIVGGDNIAAFNERTHADLFINSLRREKRRFSG